MAVVDAWSEIMRLKQSEQAQAPVEYRRTEAEPQKESEQKTMANLYTLIAVRKASKLEQEQGTGDKIIAGPVTLTAADSNTACAQFGAQASKVISEAPAGLLEVTVKNGL